MNKRLEDAINHVGRDEPAPEVAAEAAQRVRGRLFETAPATGLRECADFRALFPGYLQRALAENRRLLVEDHLHACPACRRSLDELRHPVVREMPVVRPSIPWGKLAMAAAVTLAAGLGALRLTMPGVFDGAPATIHAANGLVYRLDGAGVRPVGEGFDLAANEEIQTGRGATAVVRLFDGSMVELAERSQISVSRGWSGTTIRLARGNVIVEAAKQKRGRLLVAAGDTQVAVKGTIFAVARGLRGSRVSVVEGEVEVSNGGAPRSLTPGQQATTDPSLQPNAVTDEVAWSRNSARYLALLGELSALQRKLEDIPSPALRLDSKLLRFIPPDTVALASIPNLGNTIGEAKRVFDEQLRESPMLQQWWSQNKSQAEVDELVRWVQDLSGQLGEEILVAMNKQGPESAVALAELRGSGLDAVLARHATKIRYAIRNGIVIFAADAERLRGVEALVAAGGSPTTPFREQVAESYRHGAGWLFAADLHAITKPGGPLHGARYLVIERREVNHRVENAAAVNFTGPRSGVAAWLAAPATMGSLDFVTPEAGGAVAFVVKTPRTIVEEAMRLTGQKSTPETQALDDLAAPLGTEAAFALDGPLLPTPSWKAIVEVYQPQRLQAAIEQAIETANREGAQVTLTAEEVSGRTFYLVKAAKAPIEIHYTYVDSYLVAGANRSLLTQAIQARQTGRNLARSQKFRDQLPSGSNPNVSALVYHDMGNTFGAVADLVEGSGMLTGNQRSAIQAMRQGGPGLVVAYGDADRITASTQGSFLGMNLGMLAGLDGLPQLLRRP